MGVLCEILLSLLWKSGDWSWLIPESYLRGWEKVIIFMLVTRFFFSDYNSDLAGYTSTDSAAVDDIEQFCLYQKISPK